MDAEVEADNAFAMYRGFLWLIGVWPLEKKNAFKTFRFVVAIIFQISLAIHTTVELYMNNGQISAMVDVVLFCSSAYLTVTKNSFLRLYQDRLAENLKSYNNDWIATKDENLLEIMRNHVKIYRYQFILYNSAGYAGTTMFVIRTIIVNVLNKHHVSGTNETFEYQFAVQTSYLSQETLTNYYGILMTIMLIQLLYCCTAGACTDCFYFGLSLHLCAQLEILKIEWKNLTMDRIGRSSEGQKAKVVELINRHKHLLNLGENLEESFNRTMLVQLVISVILVCVSGCSVLVSLMNQDYMTMIISTNCICFMITESFIYGYASDYMMTQSENIVQAVYSADWYQLENKIKKDIVFVMMRARIPIVVTAGKFFYVTRNTIIQLLKTSFSFLSVLRISLEKQNNI